MSLLVKGRQEGREIVAVTPESAGWSYVGFAAYRLVKDEEFSFYTGGREMCIVILRGIVSVEVGKTVWSEIGKRDSVFERVSPYSVYVPHRQAVCITAHGDVEIAVCSAPGNGDFSARLIEPASAVRSIRGQGSNTRYVCDILPQSAPADHLLIVEVITPGGHSSSYPPHKHDTDNIPDESALEETYYHRINPSQGFAFQRVYTDDRSLDESMAVENHDVVMVPKGYHPVVAPHGYDCYYLNVMAGSRRSWHFKNDPAHDWLMRR
ncbi:5-deoxy-glucuronate isomerase [Glaciimonas sp. PAMC28666]|uniref:5-deoxy-glucuronate isomerase n=1 Tax=Glaciimonas sp. PAMC28666 TaxID=2807626 RepID=UPI001964AA98|nr:5-deoxy-glucuronate isomerase [Glaciimonas sp. PAMC28666]QRX82981.1 5-deoxy-glucuronate isomerase [Glaciimonas sp. PAMC28666]